MTIICVLRPNNPETPVELYLDASLASHRMSELFATGEEGLSLYTTEL